MNIIDVKIKEYDICNDDITYYKYQFERIGMCYILQHPYLKDTCDDANMYLVKH